MWPKKHLLLLSSLLLLLALVAAQCGDPASEESEAPAATEEETAAEPVVEETEAAVNPAAEGDFSGLKIAMLTSGPINDDGWNQSAYEGLLTLEAAGAEIANTENIAQADQLDLLRSYADQGFNIIIGHGFEYGDALLAAGDEYPEVSFIQIGGIAANGKNIAAYNFKAGEPGYVVGILAGMMTQSNKIGGVGAIEIPVIANDFNAYSIAAKLVNPNIEDVPIAYTGSWVDIPLAKEAAIAQIDSSIDIIFANGDNANVGAIEAAAEHGATYAIGMTRDQSHLAPDLVLTSVIQRIDLVLLEAVNNIQSGDIKWDLIDVGLAEGGHHLAPLLDTVPAEVVAEVEAVTQAIIDGKITFDFDGNVTKDEYH